MKEKIIKNIVFLSCIISMGNQSFANKAEEVFTEAYLKRAWKEPTSFSGPGSSLEQTEVLRKALPVLFNQYDIKSVNDVPCGDFNWMKNVSYEGMSYNGFDIVAALVESNNALYKSANIHFYKKDAITELLPKADLIFCRDMLVHFPIREILVTLANFKASGSKYLLTTTFTRTNKVNKDIPFGVMQWRPLNLELPPFNFPKPLMIINENCTEGKGLFADKCVALWLLDDIKLDVGN